MSDTYVVLLSGGIDSVVNLHEALLKGEVRLALTFDYGQRSRRQEIQAAKYFSEKLKTPHQTVDVPWLGKITRTALVNDQVQMPHLNDLDDLTEGMKSAAKVWVPNRNGVFLNIA